MYTTFNLNNAIMFPMVDKIDFVEWVEEMMHKEGINQSELARRGGLSRSAVSKLLRRDQRGPGPEMCEALARAFKLPTKDVYIIAGLLPPETKQNLYVDELAHKAGMLLREADIQELIYIAEIKLERQEHESDPKKSGKSTQSPAAPKPAEP